MNFITFTTIIRLLFLIIPSRINNAKETNKTRNSTGYQKGLIQSTNAAENQRESQAEAMIDTDITPADEGALLLLSESQGFPGTRQPVDHGRRFQPQTYH